MPLSLPDENTLMGITVTLAKQGQILEALRQDSQEIREDIKGIRLELKEYVPRAELRLQLDVFTGSITVLQAQVRQLLDYQLAETKRSGEITIASNEKITQAKEEAKDMSNKVLIGIQGATLATIIGFLLWLLENYLSHPR